jgi:hypothetical protein
LPPDLGLVGEQFGLGENSREALPTLMSVVSVEAADLVALGLEALGDPISASRRSPIVAGCGRRGETS